MNDITCILVQNQDTKKTKSLARNLARKFEAIISLPLALKCMIYIR